MGLVAEVYFPLRLAHGFDYIIPPHLEGRLKPGHRVLAPFGKQGLKMGVVLSLNAPSENGIPAAMMKALSDVVDPEPVLSPQDIQLARWLCKRYCCGLGEAVFGVLPIGQHLPPKRPKTGPGAAEARAAYPDHVPTDDQRSALELILPAVREKRFEPFLLFGVAAAGKTEIYMHSIAAALERGRSALYLVPEIGLTPQVEGLLRARFGERVEVWHSEISQGERWRIWQRILGGECRVVLGARSAVFAPLRDLGLIVIDEEHDASYKEDSSPRYHAREAALEKGRLHGAPVLLGSATPSMESYRRAQEGAFRLVEMSRRVEDRPFPTVHMVDMKRDWYNILSDPLFKAMQGALARREQCLLFLNRRGFSTYVICKGCGWEARCPQCAVSLVYHVASPAEAKPGAPTPQEGLRCHYCAHRSPLPQRCPRCKGEDVKLKGKGTQRAVAQIELLFPGARVLRWDRDTTRRRRAHAEAFSAVKSESVDIIVGTQMVAQGLDFPRVTVVGVLDADKALRFPDFRAGEKTFQQLTQVSGRARMADRWGEVYIQTRDPEHYAIQAASRFDYKSFAEQELTFRREMSYPPFVRLAHLLVRGKRAEQVEAAAAELVQALEAQALPEGVSVLGPAPSFRKLRAGLTQWQVILKGPDGGLESALALARGCKLPKSVFLAVDVDPEELE